MSFYDVSLAAVLSSPGAHHGHTHAVAIELSEADQAVLLGWTRRRKTAQALALRARIVLACADSEATNTAIAEAMGLSLMTVSKWRTRFAQHGIAGLDDAPRSGAPRTILDDQVQEVIPRPWRPCPRTPPTGRPVRSPLTWD